MFVGAVPRPAVEQITRVVPFDEWREVYVGCSGSFRVDRAIKARHPLVNVHSNDVSLVSCGLGALATNASFPLRFSGRLAFVEAHVDSFRDRVAAVLVALEMARHKGDNDHARAHFRHYEDRFPHYLASARTRLDGFLEGLTVASFTAGDFREHAVRAAKADGGIAAFPPTYKGGYERLYRFIDENAEWPAPSYEVWDPKRLEDWLDELDRLQVRWCVIADRALAGRRPVTVYQSPSNKPVYAYADDAGGSVRRSRYRAEPFKYIRVEPAMLGPEAEVKIVPAASEHMNFLKDRYLAKGINHVTGWMNYLVYLDGRLAGGFIFARDKSGQHDRVYLLSDFAVARERRLGKLIAMLATCRAVVRAVERRLLVRVARIYTTAFTDRPVSMKYRGIFQLMGRRPGALSYASTVREQTPNDIYREWFRRFARDPHPAGEAQGAEAPREERPLHEQRDLLATGGEHPPGRLPDDGTGRLPGG